MLQTHAPVQQKYPSYRELLGFLVPVGEEAALRLVDLEIRHLEADSLIRVAREQQELHRENVFLAHTDRAMVVAVGCQVV